MKIRNSIYVIFAVDIVVFLILVLVNLIVRSFSYAEIVDVNGTAHLQITKSYYQYFDLLTVFSLFIIIGALIITIVAIYRKQQSDFKRSLTFSKLFSINELEYIEADVATTPEETVIIDAWNRSIQQILSLQQRRDEQFNMMVHDLKMPIQLLGFNAELFELEYGNNEYVRKMSNQTNKLQKEIERILILEKIQYFEKPKYEQVDVVSIIKELTKPLSEELMLNVDSEYNCLIVHTDIHMFMKIINNLLDNVRKYSSSEQVQIKLKNKKIIITNKTTSSEEYSHDVLITRKLSSNGNGLGKLIISTYVQKLNFSMKVTLKGGVYRTVIDLSNNLLEYEKAA